MNRRRLAAAGLGALAVLVGTLVLLTPWHPLGAAAAVRPRLHDTFTDAEIARAAAFRADLGPWPFVALALGILTPWLVVLLLHRRSRARSPEGSSGAATPRQWPVVVATVVAVSLLTWVVTAPMAVHSEQVLRRYHLSTQTWAGWLRDEAVAWAIAAVLTSLALLAIRAVIRRAPRSWPYVLAAGAAVVTVLGSTVYPLVIEPAYNHFSALPAGQLEQRITDLATREGIAPVRVVVSDASSRTTGENAHVSGLGATRWVVLDDTTLARAKSDPAAVLAVVAHEFGHVRHQDVVRGTVLGALGSVAAVLLTAWVLTSSRGARLFTLSSSRPVETARGVALVMALAATLSLAAAPLSNLVSRRIEASADVHALTVTHDVPAFVRMQHDLAVSNLSRLEPSWWQTALFATHPDPVWRIAQARTWQQLHR